MNKDEKQFQRMTERPLPGLILSLGLPTLAGMLITSFYNLVDTYFVSNLGTSQSAAVSVVFSLMAIIQAAGFGIGMGSGSLISRSLGEKKEKDANEYASSAFFSAFCFGLILLILGSTFSRQIVGILGAKGEILPYAADYAKVISFGAPIMCASFVINNVLRAQGKTVSSMIGLTFGGILNMFLDYLFIRHFQMGVGGAALATVIGQAASFSVLLLLSFSKSSIVRFRFSFVSRRAKTYFMIFKNGLPTFFRQGLASFSTAILNHIATSLTPSEITNEALVAAVGICTKIYMFVRSVVIGFGQGYQPIAGYNYGAKKYDRVKKAFRLVVLYGTAFCIVATVGMTLFAEPVMNFFIQDSNPEKERLVIEMGKKAMIYLAFTIPFLSYSTMANQTLQVLGQSTGATFLASCRQGIFYVPLIFILSRFFHINGVLLTQPLADLLTLLVTIPLQIRFFKTMKGNLSSQ